MKKNIFRLCSLAAVAAAMTACSSEEPAQVASSESATQGFTISAQLPIDNALRPRSTGSTVLAQGSNIKRFIYAVYNSSKELLASDVITVSAGTKTVSFNVSLPTHVPYYLFMWADAGSFTKIPDEAPYYVDLDSHTVTMNTAALASEQWRNISSDGLLYPVADAQPDDMDAFMCFTSIFPSGTGYTSNVSLTRPLVAMALMSNGTDGIYEAAKKPLMGSKWRIMAADAAPFADSYNFMDDTVSMSETAQDYITYVDFTNDVNSFFCPWGWSSYKVLAWQYSFAPKSSENIPFEAASPSIYADFTYYDGSSDYNAGFSNVTADLGDPADWFKPNTIIVLRDDVSGGGTSALVNSSTVTATVSTGFDSQTKI